MFSATKRFETSCKFNNRKNPLIPEKISQSTMQASIQAKNVPFE